MKIAVLIGMAAFGAVGASAQVLTQWNFNGGSSTTVPGGNSSPTASTGVGTASLLGGVTASFASGIVDGGSTDPIVTSPPNYAWNIANYAPQGTESGLRGVQFNVSTVGFQNVEISFDVRKSGSASRYQEVLYTLDGSSFTSIGLLDGDTANTWFNGNSFDLSSIAGANNNANFGFKVVTVFAPGGSAYLPTTSTGVYGTSGTTRFDMVTVNAEAIPEPATMGVVGLAAAALARRKRK